MPTKASAWRINLSSLVTFVGVEPESTSNWTSATVEKSLKKNSLTSGALYLWLRNAVNEAFFAVMTSSRSGLDSIVTRGEKGPSPWKPIVCEEITDGK